jgi:hypothetical protein
MPYLQFSPFGAEECQWYDENEKRRDETREKCEYRWCSTYETEIIREV